MHFSDRIPHRLAVMITAFVFCLSACAAKSDLFAYTKGAAAFDLIFPSVSGDTDAVTCGCVRDEEGNVTLTVTSPERLSGFTVISSCGNTAAGCGDTMIPLSADAAEGLTDVLDVLTEEGSAKRSPDGAYTIISAPSGTVTLDGDLLPVSAEVNGKTVGIAWHPAS